MSTKIPMAKTMQYPKLITVRVTEEIKQDLKTLKEMGVDVGTMLRDAAREKINEIKAALDGKAS